MGNGHRYRLAWARMMALVEPLPDDLPVPATPDWNLLQLLSHLAGAAADLTGGNSADWSHPHWTAAQVELRSRRSRREVLAEWADCVDGVTSRVDDPAAFGLHEAFGRMPVIDAIGHEHDIAEAAGLPVGIEHDDWLVLHDHRRLHLDAAVTYAGLPPLRVLTPEGDSWSVGGGDPTASVRLARQELWRSLTGRRTRMHVASYDWSADPTPYIAVWVGGTFSWPAAVDLGHRTG
ncbi:MAG: hypothetical protein KGR47_10185 [Acidobacteria bacterium]|nr:hypothetical protein [Acidobacteriota bacterium]